MARYTYNQQVRPPAPFVYVRLAPWENEASAERVPAQIDTAADVTVIPERFVDELGLLPSGEVAVGGFESPTVATTTYEVRLGVHDFPRARTEVIANQAERYVLLGRDVLNRHRVLLDGPRLTLEIDRR